MLWRQEVILSQYVFLGHSYRLNYHPLSSEENVFSPEVLISRKCTDNKKLLFCFFFKI
jgi:hypothetical protein